MFKVNSRCNEIRNKTIPYEQTVYIRQILETNLGRTFESFLNTAIFDCGIMQFIKDSTILEQKYISATKKPFKIQVNFQSE